MRSGSWRTPSTRWRAASAQQETLRRNLVSDVAHELRTPLTNLRGYLEASRDGLIAPDATLVNNLYEETMLLQRLVLDLQDLAQVDAGQLTLLKTPTDLGSLIEQAATMFQVQAQEKGVTVVADTSEDLPPVNVDPERIAQVLRNLVSNAIAHTPSGGAVTLSAQASDHEVAVIDQRHGRRDCARASGVRLRPFLSCRPIAHPADRGGRAGVSHRQAVGAGARGFCVCGSTPERAASSPSPCRRRAGVELDRIEPIRRIRAIRGKNFQRRGQSRRRFMKSREPRTRRRRAEPDDELGPRRDQATTIAYDAHARAAAAASTPPSVRPRPPGPRPAASPR